MDNVASLPENKNKKKKRGKGILVHTTIGSYKMGRTIWGFKKLWGVGRNSWGARSNSLASVTVTHPCH